MVSETPDQTCFCTHCASEFLENTCCHAVFVSEVPNLLGTMHRCGRCLKKIPQEHYAIRAELLQTLNQIGYSSRVLVRTVETGEGGKPNEVYLIAESE